MFPLTNLDSASRRSRSLIFLALLGTLQLTLAQTPEWIWSATPKDKETRFFKKTFTLGEKVSQATLVVACDNGAEAFVNGERVLRNNEWSRPNSADIGAKLQAGENTLHIAARNDEGIAGLLVKLDLQLAGGAKQRIVSDATWLTADNATGKANSPIPTAGWVAATSLGAVGRDPWGDVLKPAIATPAESLKVAPGFKVELVRSSQPGEGSWVSMTIDPKGRLLISPQGDEPLLRLTLDASGRIERMESLSLPVKAAMGMLYAFDSLYMNGQGKEGYHLYRLKDTNGDDQFDQTELIRQWKGGPGEHGAHGIVLGQDQKLYMVNGNFVDVPTDLASSSPHKNYADDLVLPRMEDGNGFGAGRKPPGGYVLRMNADGSQPELFASGQRNTYDIAFNPAGELFGFDSDMEWDWGMPWYRPIRAFHLVSGGDHGFREGSAKWPEYYADALPATVNIGIGCPTGVRFGTGAKFPARYQRAFYMMDWTYGRLIAVHLREMGASYAGTFENFVQGKPLNLTDLEVGRDGAMYFTVGGRGTQAGLYRVTYVGNETTTPAPEVSDAGAPEARALRRKLETLHGLPRPEAVEALWPHLGSKDRFIRYAARIGLESQTLSSWRDRAVNEAGFTAGLHALLALARVGTAEDQAPLLKALARWPLDSLDEEHKLVKLRVIQVSFARHGLPSPELRKMAVDKLSRQLPATSAPLNRELASLLAALEAPGIASKILDLRDAAPTQEDQIYYMGILRTLKSGWTARERERYFSWLNARPDAPLPGSKAVRASAHPAYFNQWFADVGIPANNGASFNGFMRGLRKDSVATLSGEERQSLALLIAEPSNKPPPLHAATRPFVKEWHMADLTPQLEQVSKGRDFQRGKAAFEAAQCLTCHRFGPDGGAVGPDLTAVSSRFTRLDLLSSILEPSKVVSEQYENTTFVKTDEEEVTGRVLEENDQRLVLLINPLAGTKAELKKAEVKSRHRAKLSAMPEGLVNSLSQEEMLDLLAYVESMGNPNHALFRK